MANGELAGAAGRAVQATEWLVPDGLGGSASGTASGIPKRRAHALLTAASEHGQLTALLLSLEERLIDVRGSWDLGEPLGVPGPRAAGLATLEAFRASPLPLWRIRAGEAVLEKRVLVVHGHPAVAISYRHLSGPAVRLTVGPRVVRRAPFALQHETAEARGAAQGVPGRVRLEWGGAAAALTLWHNGMFLPAWLWRRGLEHPLDLEEELAAFQDTAAVPRSRRRAAATDAAPATEEALVPGWIEGALAAGQSLHVVVSTEEDLFRRLATEERLGSPPPRSLAACIAVLELERDEREKSVRRAILRGADYTARQAAAAHNSPLSRSREAQVGNADRWALPLGQALHGAIARRGGRAMLVRSLPAATLDAGHALRALPSLVTLREFDLARELISGITEYLDEGLAPESFDDTDGTPRYGDPEPALWLVAAAELYVRRSNDLEFLRELMLPLESIMHFYRAGTRNLRVGGSGLLETGGPGGWRARADQNALWYHALAAMAQLARLAGRRESGALYLAWARELHLSFNERMWDESAGELAIAVEAGARVTGLEASQILAASLHPSALTPDRARRLVARIERELFTPFGLRRAPDSPVAVTSWLGPYYSAYVRTHSRDAAALSRVHDWLDLLRDSLGGEHIPGVPAIFRLESGGRVRPGGVYSTAAAGELLRTWIEDLDPYAAPAARSAGVAPILA
ncbi:MAG: glycogen debranching enzyme N-terminal domain-containing protein [Candidatus Eiseniibacteriota bacterium]